MVLFRGGLVQNPPGPDFAECQGVSPTPSHVVVGSWHLRAEGGKKKLNSQACGVCFPAHQYRPELENRSNWGPKAGSVAVWPHQNLSSVWPKKDNLEEVPGRVLPVVRLR